MSGLRYRDEFSRLSVGLVFLALCGCANLEPIQKFAGDSAAVTTAADAKQAWQESYVSRQTLNRKAEWGGDPKKLWENLDAIQSVLKAYFSTMSKVAGTERSFLNDELKATVGAVKEAGSLTAAQQESAETILTAVAENIIEVRRRQELRKMIEIGNEPIGTLISDLAEVINVDMRNSLTQEVKSLDTTIEIREPGPGRVAFSLERNHLLTQRQKAVNRLEVIDSYLKALKKIREGHQNLYDNRNTLDRLHLDQDFATILSQLASVAEVAKKLK